MLVEAVKVSGSPVSLEYHETDTSPRKLFGAPLVLLGVVGASRPVLSVGLLGFRGSAMIHASTSYGCHVLFGFSVCSMHCPLGLSTPIPCQIEFPAVRLCSAGRVAKRTHK